MVRVAPPFPPSRRFAVPRLLAGAFAGLVGGLVFGVIMSLPAIAGEPAFDGMGMLTLLSRLVGTDDLGALWGIHAVASALFGVVFALIVPPGRIRQTVPLGVGWGVLLWLVNAFLLLRVLVDAPLRLDAGVVWNLLGHVAYGAFLGFAYAAFFREELGLLRDHGRAPAERWSPKP